jgi:hypothetical protein
MARNQSFTYCETPATEAEEAAMRAAYKVPYIVVGSYLPPNPAETVHAIALRHGLPEIRGHYGYDFAEHDFIRLPDANEGEPDRWPSRKISDVLASAGLT